MRKLTVAVVAGIILALAAVNAHAQSYSALLDGLQETPPNASPATGTGTFTLTGGNLSYNISFSGLLGTQTAAHIHVGAAGTPGPVVFPLSTGSPISGTWTGLTAQNLSDLNAGLLYVNVHSTLFPGGEIRGQILPVPEPSSLLVMGSAMGLLGCLRRRHA